MQQNSKYDLTKVPQLGFPITKISPKAPPELQEHWVLWEYNACLFTNGLKFTTEDLHDAIKAHAENQNLPINVFYSKDAYWLIDGAWGRAKVDDDRRPRVSLNLRNSRHSDRRFITGIEHFGDCWANFQMMVLAQPEELEKPPKPTIPDPLIPYEALIVLIIVAGVLIFSGNSGLQVLGIVGLIGGVTIWAISSRNVREATKRYEKWKEQMKEIEREEEEIKRNRLSRSFQSDDLFVFYEVMRRIVSTIVMQDLLERGAKVTGSSENSYIEKIIPKSTKDVFDDF
jgi:hypothetical protein